MPLPQLPVFPALLPMLLMVGCTSPTTDSAEDCDLRSTVASYAPACSAVLALFPEESRLQVDGRLVAYLPADPVPAQYGGISGNSLTVLLDEELAVPRESTVTLGENLESARLDLVFDSGRVEGFVFPTVVNGE